MVIKFIGAIIIGISSYLFGVIKLGELKASHDVFTALKNDVITIKSEIEFTKTPITEIIYRLKENKNCLSDAYDDFLKQLNEDIDIDISWKNSIDILNLKNNEKNLLYNFSSCFLSTDIDGQISKLNFFTSELDNAIINLDEYIKKNEKLYKNFCFYCGALLIVLLL